MCRNVIPRIIIHGNIIPRNVISYLETNTPLLLVIIVFIHTLYKLFIGLNMTYVILTSGSV